MFKALLLASFLTLTAGLNDLVGTTRQAMMWCKDPKSAEKFIELEDKRTIPDDLDCWYTRFWFTGIISKVVGIHKGVAILEMVSPDGDLEKPKKYVLKKVPGIDA